MSRLIVLAKNTVLFVLLLAISCGSETKADASRLKAEKNETNEIVVGANQTHIYLPLLNAKRVGVVANQTSVIFKDQGYTHLVDSLLSRNIDVVRVFAPEHGFRGTADAGEIVKDGRDLKTGLPIISLYGENKKPAFQDHDLDVVIFDIQDVGARFYTYISTLHYVMEACAENEIALIVLDRPNPNGHYVDGPILEEEHSSFVGMHTVPVVHGMTIGEYAQMINGEGWLADGLKCNLTIIKASHYSHSSSYSLPIKPSPNLPNDKAINLYPSLCFFEGTNVSAGRGTEQQFQIFGSPFLNPEYFSFQFTPQPNEGAKHPKHKGELCYGMDLSQHDNLSKINLEWLIEAYNATENKTEFFNAYFTKLAGTNTLREQIEQGFTADEIRKSWRSGIDDFKKLRSKYLIYN